MTPANPALYGNHADTACEWLTCFTKTYSEIPACPTVQSKFCKPEPAQSLKSKKRMARARPS